MVNFVGAEKFVGGEIMKRESKLLLQRILYKLNGCPSAQKFSQCPNARQGSWEPKMKMSIREQKTLSWKAMKHLRIESSEQLTSLSVSEL